MKHIIHLSATALLAMAAVMPLASCSSNSDDPSYENVQPPTLTVAPNTLSGVITAKDGTAIEGATVSLDTKTATTDKNGVYRFDNIGNGTYTVHVTATGKNMAHGEISVPKSSKSQDLIWNAVLTADGTKTLTFDANGNASATVETECLKGNEKAKVETTVTIPTEGIQLPSGVALDDVTFSVAPAYDEDAVDEAATRASQETMLTGVTLSCSVEGVKLTKPVSITMSVDKAIAGSAVVKKYVEGAWEAAQSTVSDGTVTIQADEFTSYGLFLSISFSEASASADAVNFTQSTWDNLNGSAAVTVASASYTYSVGTKITSTATSQLGALLIEKLAARYGAASTTATGSYPLNVTLPVGTKLALSATQAKQTVSAAAAGTTVSGTKYGTVTVTATTSNRSHTGGSSI